ncbi:MAG TPA: hypothetical protein VFJ43_04145, partial [Bacteroidia bacterium]|nr:hypothetical protein [Bacteroidia bacterium]
HFDINPSVKLTLTLAHDFSELMYGAHLAYNCQLQHKIFNNSIYDSQWQEWIGNIKTNMIDYGNFDPIQLEQYSTTTRSKTKLFIQEWWKQVKQGFPDLDVRDKMIHDQEVLVKRGKARLQWNKTDDVREETWIGLSHFEYRFPQARIILKDVKTGLETNNAAP